MTSDTLTYQTETETAIFSGPTYIRADSNLIYTENGWYDTKNNLASFQENSYLEADGQVLTGDSLFYDRNLGFGEVFNNMQIRDTANTFVIQGNYGWHNEKQEQSLITDSLLLIQIFENDSLFLHADTAVINIDSTDGKIIQAFHDVKFFKSDLQGAADSMLITQFFLSVPWPLDSCKVQSLPPNPMATTACTSCLQSGYALGHALLMCNMCHVPVP